MCTELFLAIIYFITIFSVNYFLYRLLSTYISNIIYLLKIQNIFKYHNPRDLNIFILLHLYIKGSANNASFLNFLNKCNNTRDVLTISNTYSYLLNNSQKNGSDKLSNNFYLELLENQYLSKSIYFED